MQANVIDQMILYVYVILEAVSFVFCMVGNIAVIYVLVTKKKLSRTSNMYILSTSVADFLIGFFVIPYGIMQVIWFCNSWNFLKRWKQTYRITGFWSSSSRVSALRLSNFVCSLFLWSITDIAVGRCNWQISSNLLSNISLYPQKSHHKMDYSGILDDSVYNNSDSHFW